MDMWHLWRGLLLLVTACLCCAVQGERQRSSPSPSSSREGPTWETEEVPGLGRVLKVEHLDIYPAPYLKISPVSPQIRAGEERSGERPDTPGGGPSVVGNSKSLQIVLGGGEQEERRKEDRGEGGKTRHRKHRRQQQQQQGGKKKGPVFPLVSSNPLKDQPNLSEGKQGKARRRWSTLDSGGGRADSSVVRGGEQSFPWIKVDELKKEMCTTQPFKQVIEEPGCQRVTRTNRFCYGQCNSFYIPQWENSQGGGGGEPAFHSVAQCRPHRGRWIHVRLNCPNQRPRRQRRRIYLVKDCTCMAQEFPVLS